MKAIEINSKTDEHGHLKIDYKADQKDQRVRVLLLFDEDNGKEDDDVLWLQAISNNPAFDFLNNPEEDIYTLKDGVPLDD